MTTCKLDYLTIVADLKQTASKHIGTDHFRVKGGKVLLQISDSPEINARAYPSADDQYIVRIYRGVLEACLEFVQTTVNDYYSTISNQTQFDRNMFLRAVCSCVTEFLFLHEYCHIIRGHFQYKEHRKTIWEEHPELETADKRFFECDADIFAANALLARTYSVFKDPNVSYRLHDLMQAYVIGIRSIFEVLYKASGIEDLIHEESDHPHSLIRAFIAVSMGVSGSISEQLGDDTEKCREFALNELLSFQIFMDKTSPLDPIFLQENLEKELKIWSEWSETLRPLYLLEIKQPSKLKRAYNWLQSRVKIK